MSEAAIKQAALEAGAGRVHRIDGDIWTDGSINLSKFVRFLARQPHVVSAEAARIEMQDTSAAYNAAYDHGFRAGIEECARLVESTGLRNPSNIARDIRALKAALAPEQDK